MIAGIDVTFRYRVGTVEGVYDDGAVSLHDVREFVTLAGAERCRDRLARTSARPVLLQVGVLQWTTPENAERLVGRLVDEGARLR